jgi:hypothetical protein
MRTGAMLMDKLSQMIFGNVRFRPKADMSQCTAHVRFRG